MPKLLERIEKLNEIGIALSAEEDTQKLLENILLGAMSLTHADGGTLYLKQNGQLKFEIIHNNSLGIHMGGPNGKALAFPPIELYVNNEPNHSMVAAHVAVTAKTINVDDVYVEKSFDFTGAKSFDSVNQYRTQSILTIPLKDHENDVIGVLQLINAKDLKTKQTTSFSKIDQQLSESLASQAAVALTQKQLITELKELFEAFIKMMADAIDEKSPYTGGHCRRIPVLTMLLAEAANNEMSGPLKNFHINDKDRYELETAAWLHDCGKVITPEHVMDKATKLETIFDRIELIEHRFEILMRDAEIVYLKSCLQAQKEDQAFDKYEALYKQTQSHLKDSFAFLQKVNIGSEFMDDDDVKKVSSIASLTWESLIHSSSKLLLDSDEQLNLSIRKGTLNDGERTIINDHIVATIKMLEALPFPKHLKNVPEYAGGHHEKMDGTGYPKGLKKEEMSVQARIMAVADIFEALSARDRPYKPGKKISECIRIMGFMAKDKHIDEDLYDIFIKEKVYLKYAEEFLDPSQLD